METPMKDNELRAIVLQKYYDLRRLGTFQWAEIPKDDFPAVENFEELARISDQLAEHGLIEWKPLKQMGSRHAVGGLGKITAFGVDVIEGTANSPISITFDHRQTVSITGSNNIVGNNNSLNADEISVAINESGFSETEKAEAKSLWQKVCNNKLLNTVIGSVTSAATKRALEIHTG